MTVSLEWLNNSRNLTKKLHIYKDISLKLIWEVLIYFQIKRL